MNNIATATRNRNNVIDVRILTATIHASHATINHTLLNYCASQWLRRVSSFSGAACTCNVTVNFWLFLTILWRMLPAICASLFNIHLPIIVQIRRCLFFVVEYPFSRVFVVTLFAVWVYAVFSTLVFGVR